MNLIKLISWGCIIGYCPTTNTAYAGPCATTDYDDNDTDHDNELSA
jgi:hypothetical protein